jgi:hypothetical protein
MTVYRESAGEVRCGSIVFDSASSAAYTENSVDPSASAAICCDAMNGTATVAMPVECAEQPLQLRRLAKQLRFAVKVTASDHPSAKPVNSGKSDVGYSSTVADDQYWNYRNLVLET